MKLKNPATLSDVILATQHACKRSFDTRFDGKHPIELAIENLQTNGFTNEQVFKLLHHKASVKSNQIKGSLLFLNNFITDSYRTEIIEKLRGVTLDKYGNFIRNGVVF